MPCAPEIHTQLVQDAEQQQIWWELGDWQKLATWVRQRTSLDVCQLLQHMAPCTHIQTLRTIVPALPLLSKFYPNYVTWPMLTQNHTGHELGTVAPG